MRSVLAQLRVPGAQVLVGHLPRAVKHEDAGVGLGVQVEVSQRSVKRGHIPGDSSYGAWC